MPAVRRATEGQRRWWGPGETVTIWRQPQAISSAKETRARVRRHDPTLELRQRIASIEANLDLVNETIAAIGDAARETFLEDASDGTEVAGDRAG